MQSRAQPLREKREPFVAGRNHRREAEKDVNRLLEASIFDGHAGRLEPLGVRVPFVAERIASCRDDEVTGRS